MSADAPTSDPAAIFPSALSTIDLAIEGMTCGSCAVPSGAGLLLSSQISSTASSTVSTAATAKRAFRSRRMRQAWL